MLEVRLTLSMGRKKYIKNLAKASLKITNSGKIKVDKNHKIDITPFVKDSVEKSVVSRLSALISKESVAVDATDMRCCSNNVMLPEINIAQTLYNESAPIEDMPTICITVPKSKALEIFDFLDSGCTGEILRVSTLASVYKQIKQAWVDLNEDDPTEDSNIMYVPNVMFFVDLRTGKPSKHPFKANILVVAVPSKKNMVKDKTSTEDITDEYAVHKIVNDTVEAAIRLGVKELIIDPLSAKFLRKNVSLVGYEWETLISSQRVMENLKEVSFSLTNDEAFVRFTSARRRAQSQF